MTPAKHKRGTGKTSTGSRWRYRKVKDTYTTGPIRDAVTSGCVVRDTEVYQPSTSHHEMCS